MNVDERIREEALARPEHASPSGITGPGLFPSNPMPSALLRRVVTGCVEEPIVTKVSQSTILDRYGELRAIGEPDAGGEVDVEDRRPVGARVRLGIGARR